MGRDAQRSIPYGDQNAEEELRKDTALLMVGDYLAFWLAVILGQAILAYTESGPWYLNWLNLWNWDDKPRLYIFFGLACLAIFSFWTHLCHYTYCKPFWTELHETWRMVTGLAIIDLALKALLNVSMSHLWWTLTWGALLATIPAIRFLIRRLLVRRGYLRKPTFIIGSGPNSDAAHKALCSEINMGCAYAGTIPLFTLGPTEVSSVTPSCAVPCFGLEKLKNAKVVFALESGQEVNLDSWIRELVRIGATDISVIPPTKGIPLYGAEPCHLFSHDILMLRIRNNLARKWMRLSKRLFDLVAAIIITVMLSPLLLLLYCLVARTGPNPIFGHKRVGQGGTHFHCYKFRTMVPDAAERLTKLLRDSPEARAEWDREFKLKNDPRITAIGHFLRKTSLDELPQLWNVIKGDMSLVGPRPVIEEEIERYGENAIYYWMTKPGMTGLWQVSGRNDIDYPTRVYLDVWYLKNWSLWYDLAIIFKTFRVLVQRGGAY